MDEDPLRRKNILNVLLAGSVIMLVILDAFILFYSLRDGAAYPGIPFTAFSVLPAFFILLSVLSYRGFSRLASYLLIGTYLVSDSYVAYRWGVRVQVVLIAYALIIVMATILHGTKFGFLITGVIAAFIVSVWYAQVHGILPMRALRPTADDAVVFSVLYFLIMTVAWLYDREIQRSLRRAKSSEQALKEERDLLEVKVTERTDELRRAQFDEVQQMSRLAELGQLSSGLFHDLLNLLNALSLRTEDESDPSLVSAFDTTRQIENFMQAVRKQIGDGTTKESFSLTQGIHHVIQLVNYKANKERVRIMFRPEPDANIIHFDVPFKFQEIAINLLLNAIESYECLPVSDARARTIVIDLKKNGETAALRVEDNGCGMPPEVKAKIFEPFFTTKGSAKGIGIGLATIKKIIEEDLMGAISVESRPGFGSKFIVTFPIQHEGLSDVDRKSARAYQETTIP
jgi:signal transduction histidine kinase